METDLAARIARLKADFRISFAESAEDFMELHRLRYDVFCSQRRILTGENGTEGDPYDATSRHILLRRSDGEMVGTVRLVLPVPGRLGRSFPLQRVCNPELLSGIPLATTGEISRFCLSRDRRDSAEHADTVLRLGLMKGIVRASTEAKLTHWCAAMEKGLLRLLHLAAIWFEPVGPPIEYFGTRQPAVANIADVLKRGKLERRPIWNYVTDGDFNLPLTAVEPRLPGEHSLSVTNHLAGVEALRQQTVLAKFGEFALRSDDLDEILAEACRLVGEALDTDRAKVVELQKDEHTLLVRASVGWKPHVVTEMSIQATNDSLEGLALRIGEPVISPDILLETRFTYPQFLLDDGVRAVANVVVIGDRGRPAFGMLQIESRQPRQFNDGDTQFLRSYANLIATAVDRLRVIEEMRHGQQRLRLALEAGGLGSWEIDLTNGSMTGTPRTTQIFGFTDPQLVWNYDRLLSHVSPEYRQHVVNTFHESVKARTKWHFECPIQREDDGEVRWIEWNGRLAGGPRDAPPTELLGIVADITVRKAAEEALNTVVAGRTRDLLDACRVRDQAEQASSAKSRFLTSMSHELRTPLTGILGYAELLRLEGGLNDTQSARVDAMVGAGTHLLQVINSVLDLSGIEAGRVELHRVDFGLSDVARECLDLMRPAANAKGLSLSSAVEPDVPESVTSDPMRLRQVLLNLLGNAVKFTPHGSVALQLKRVANGAGLRFEVKDTGPGISAGQRKRLFHDFERFDTNTAGAEGAGLGLALSARLATLMGGRIGYEDHDGGGSVFWLELPILAANVVEIVRAKVSVPGSLPEAARPKALRILVVDDSAMNRDITGSFLRAAGHEVVLASGGKEAVELATTTSFDIILMDVRMPDVDGLEATRHIRAITGRHGRVPILALSALVFAQQVEECREAGMDGHLAKPFTPEALLHAVHEAAANVVRPEETHEQIRGATSEPVIRVALPSAITIPEFGSDLLILNPAMFERTAAFLEPQTVASHLRTLAERSEDLLSAIGAKGVAPVGSDALAAASHTLAGSAGMFGFERLAAIAGRFEYASKSDAKQLPVLVGNLTAAIRASVQEMRHRAPITAAQPQRDPSPA
jgi:N-acyl amino acid synthase of PEP-CTERM/exosortase system